MQDAGCCTASEINIIGGLLTDSALIHDLAGTLTPEDFFVPEHSRIYGYILDANRDNLPLDLATIAEKSRVALPTLAQLMADGWMTAAIKSQAERVINLAHKRRAKRGCLELASQVDNLTPQEISAKLSDMAAMISLRSASKKVYDSKQLTHMVFNTQEERQRTKTYIQGARMGFPTLDDAVRGLRPKRMTVIAANTGFGKSTLALNLLHNIGVNGGHNILFLSNENDVQDNLDRLCGICAKVDVKDVESGREFIKVSEKFQRDYWTANVYLSDNSPRDIDEVIATISRYAITEKIEIAVVDYIGEISGQGQDRENEEQRLARYAQRLVETSKSLNIHLIVLAQMNRQGLKGRPTKGDLAACYRIAQKAHTLLVFWQDEGKTDIITIDKNRQGPPGLDVEVEFNRSTQYIREVGPYVK